MRKCACTRCKTRLALRTRLEVGHRLTACNRCFRSRSERCRASGCVRIASGLDQRCGGVGDPDSMKSRLIFGNRSLTRRPTSAIAGAASAAGVPSAKSRFIVTSASSGPAYIYSTRPTSRTPGRSSVMVRMARAVSLRIAVLHRLQDFPGRVCGQCRSRHITNPYQAVAAFCATNICVQYLHAGGKQLAQVLTCERAVAKNLRE